MDQASYQRWVRDVIFECNEAADVAPLAIHRFNPAIAVDYGIPAALVFQSVHDRCQKSGLKGVLAPLSVLVSQHPYLGRSALYAGRKKLVHGTRTSQVLLLREQSSWGYLYRPISGDLYDSQRQSHLFDVTLATQVGVVPALVYRTAQHVNMNSHLLDPVSAERRRRWKWLAGHCRKHHDYVSERTIQRALKALVGNGLIQRGRGGYRNLWSVKEKSPALN